MNEKKRSHKRNNMLHKVELETLYIKIMLDSGLSKISNSLCSHKHYSLDLTQKMVDEPLLHQNSIV